MDHERKTAVAGVVLVRGRTRIWVADGQVHWQEGRTTTVVPGAGVQRVECSGQQLTLELFEAEPLTARHRSPEVVEALAAEIEALIGDTVGDRVPIRRETPSVWLVRVVRAVVDGVRDWARQLTISQRWWLAYVVVGLALDLGVPGAHWLFGLPSLALFAAGFGLVRVGTRLAKPRTRWVVARRGVTVQAKMVTEGVVSGVRARFRTLDGAHLTVNANFAGRREEVRYDPRDPSRALLPTRIAWLFELVGGLLVVALGLALTVPLAAWALDLILLIG